MLAGRYPAALDKVGEEVRSLGGEPTTGRLDLSDAESVHSFAALVREHCPRVNLLVHCGAAYERRGVDELTSEELDALYHTNVRGPMLLTRDLLPLLTANAADVVFVNSSVVDGTGAGVSGYAATKQALRAYADALRAEMNPRGVRVLSVYPGRTNTPLQARIFEAEQRPYQPERLLQPEDVVEIVLRCVDLPDTAEVTELKIRPRYRQSD